MIKNIIRFIRLDLIVVLALFTGTLFGIWMGFNPAKLSAAAYVEQMQNVIRSLGPIMPPMAFASVILATTLAILTKGDGRTRYLLFTAAVCIISGAVITHYINVPINTQIMTWRIGSPPGNWMELRDQWWTGHVARTLTTIAGFVLALLAVLRSSRSSPN